jgi:hypothetical protein
MSKRAGSNLSVSNPKILKFFHEHQNLDFEETVLSFVEIMEKLSDSMNNSINNSLITDILSNIKSMNSKMESIDQNVYRYQSESVSNLSLKLNEFKKEYIEDLRLVLTSNVADKIEPLMKEQLSNLFDKTASIIPQHNNEIKQSIQQSMELLSNSLTQETQKLLQTSITQQSLNKFISDVETKLSSTFHNTITSTEQRLDSKISDIGEKTTSQLSSTTSLNTSVSELLKKLENSSAKGKMSENILVNILHSLYPASQIDHVGQTKETGDVIITRKDKPKILVENKDWGKNVVQEEVKKFIHDIETQKCCGIFLSQNYGIANKENYEINIHDGNVLVYVHETKNDPEKIKIAIDIVDHIKEQLDELVRLKTLKFLLLKNTSLLDLLPLLANMFVNFADLQQKMLQLKVLTLEDVLLKNHNYLMIMPLLLLLKNNTLLMSLFTFSTFIFFYFSSCFFSTSFFCFFLTSFFCFLSFYIRSKN